MVTNQGPDQGDALKANEFLLLKIAQAELELKLAQTELDRAKIAREAERALRPWWRSWNWNVAAITAILAAMAPLTAGVIGHFERQKQLALAEQQQEQESLRNNQRQLEDMRNRYLDRVSNPRERRRTLRFLMVASTDPALKGWAEQEIRIVEDEAKRIDAEIAMLEKCAAESEAQYFAALVGEKDRNTRLQHLRNIAKDARRAADEVHPPVGASGPSAQTSPATGSTVPVPAPASPLHEFASKAQEDRKRLDNMMSRAISPSDK